MWNRPVNRARNACVLRLSNFRPGPGAGRRWCPVFSFSAVLFFQVGCAVIQPRLPPGLCFRGAPAPGRARFLYDLTYTDAAGVRHSDQCIFNTMKDMVRKARTFVVADMFLYNDWIGNAPRAYRHTAEEFTEILASKKHRCPQCKIVLITDPINTLYGGCKSPFLERLRAAGVRVVVTDLRRLPDSNPAWSTWWRLFIAPFGNRPGGILPNPFGPGRVTFRSYFALLNFKANHRKVLVCDPGGRIEGLVTSLNPHDGSSAHTNTAVCFNGSAAVDLLRTELAVARFSGGVEGFPAVPDTASARTGGTPAGKGRVTVQVVTEEEILETLIGMLEHAGPGDRADLVMFYLSDRKVVRAIERAHRRGVKFRIVLDPNKDAFGRIKNGIPNRQVAWELHRAGIPVRWYDTHGEQCHAKILMVRYGDGSAALLAGSSNFTRRNLENFNLETDVVVRGPTAAPIFTAAAGFLKQVWGNRGGRHCTLPFFAYRETSWLKWLRYRFMEWSGISTF